MSGSKPPFSCPSLIRASDISQVEKSDNLGRADIDMLRATNLRRDVITGVLMGG